VASRRHLVAVNRMLRSVDLDEAGRDAAVVELARDFARRMDSAGDDAAVNLLRGYQSALKDLQRAAERVESARLLPRVEGDGGASAARDEPEPEDPAESFFDD